MEADELKRELKLFTGEAAAGIFLVRATGKLLDEDKTYLEVIIGSKSVYAKPCFPFGWCNVLTEEWLNKHKGEYGFWVIFENGDDTFPVLLGMCPLDKKAPTGNYPNTAFFDTEKFEMTVDDKDEKVKFAIKDGKYLELGKDKVSFGGTGNKEKAALGETLKGLVSDLCDAASDICDAATALTVTCSAPGSPSTPPVNLAQFVTAKGKISAVKGRLDSMLSQVFEFE